MKAWQLLFRRYYKGYPVWQPWVDVYRRYGQIKKEQAVLCKDLKTAMEQAQRNADDTGVPWRYFTDPSGRAHCEKVLPDQRTDTHSTWSGVVITVVQPSKQKG